MKLEDPDLLRKEATPVAWGLVPYTKNYKSLYCRNGYHHRCGMASCQCECHTEASKQLAHHLKEKGAVLVDANGFRKCYGMDCTNRVAHENDLFCAECNKGNTPRVRAQQVKDLIDHNIERHLTRPL
jgi:hypothetical protein